MPSRVPFRRAPALAALALLAFAAARPFREEPILLGEGKHRYAWVRGWGDLPTGERLGNTHGCLVIDSAGRVYANTDTEQAVVIFSANGERIGAWGKELAGGLHGMALCQRDGRERLFLTHTGRHQVLEATLEGEILWTAGWPEESGLYTSPDEYLPTSVAVRDDGSFYVADGYGKSWIHQYDSERSYVRSFGGAGSEPGKLRTPHGIWLDTRGEQPVLLVADRENERLQSFDLDGNFLRVVATGLKRPCHVHPRGDELAVPELAGGVAILDGTGKLVTRLGESADPARRANHGVTPEQWIAGQFTAPHCARFDAQGNLYVLDWSATGRVSKLERRR